MIARSAGRSAEAGRRRMTALATLTRYLDSATSGQSKGLQMASGVENRSGLHVHAHLRAAYEQGFAVPRQLWPLPPGDAPLTTRPPPVP